MKVGLCLDGWTIIASPRRMVLGAAALAASFGMTSVAQAADCGSLAALSLPNTVVTQAEEVQAGTLTVSPALTLTDLPAFCRVAGVIRPTGDSDIRFEVWLPRSDWNGRYQQVGNGGLAGSVLYQNLAPQLQQGFAVASTDDGHQASELDGSWALGHPEKVRDFGHRAVHLTSMVGKLLVAAFYGREAAYSYFTACSEGGREAHMEAQRFPSDFDGILVGSPANHWTDLMARFVWDQQALLGTEESYIPPAKLPAIQAATLAACDALDGVPDGVATDPRRCHWDPAALLCPDGSDDNTCLTMPQAQALRAIYAGPSDPSTGQQISTGYERTGENSGNWNSYIVGNTPGNALQLLFSSGFYQGFVFEDPDWDFRTFDFHRDVALTRQKLAATLDATDPDLRAFQRRGGKMIQYHGWIDASPQPRGSIQYYESVVANQASRWGERHGLSRTQRFYRLFMAPGMEHCLGGPGPNVFGQPFATVPPPSRDAQHDILAALVTWVELGRAPAKIVATKYVNDDPAQGIQVQRPLCPYPAEAQWTGDGSTNDPDRFRCE